MQRPDSPPPRQPSPDILPIPLPYPRHPRRIHSQPKIKIHTSPPGLDPSPKTLQQARSCDFLHTDRHSDDDHSSLYSARKRTQSVVTPTLAVSPDSTTPSSSRAPSVKNGMHFAPTHRRTLSVAFPNSSPPSIPSPAASVRSLAVPSAPYHYTGPRHIVCPQPVSPMPIILPDIDQPRSDVRFPPANLDESKVFQPPQPLERHKSMGIACLKFFGIRSTSQRPQTRVTTTTM